MNIAFPALLIFLLALPGIILRSSYREWGWKFPVYRLPIGEEVARSLFYAAGLNLLWYGLAGLAGYRIVFKDVLILLTGGTGLPPSLLGERLNAIVKFPGAIAAYFLGLYFVSAVFGFLGRKIVRGCRLDLRYKFLRFDNFWHYALNAELPLFFENRKAYAQIAKVPEKELEDQEVLVRVSCVVNHGSSSFVYEGTPFDYYFDRDGKLEKIVVKDVTYEKLYDFTSPSSAPKEGEATDVSQPGGNEVDSLLSIEADVFVLNASDIHNLGIEYFFLPEETAVSAQGGNDAPSPDSSKSGSRGSDAPSRPGVIESPFAPGKFVDLSSFAPGTEVKDPFTGKAFKVPPR
jgi:hypothetical protein